MAQGRYEFTNLGLFSRVRLMTHFSRTNRKE
jgi:hypothetical protein